MSQKADKELVQFQADLLQSVREMRADCSARATTVTLPDARNKAGISQAPSKTPMTEAELLARDAQRDIGAELLESVKQMLAGEGRVVFPLPDSMEDKPIA
ncbi:MAG: hypothetical protein NT086_08000 [Proteobacteria bacterium]|nr:hypothetical protein [Pseudomonadota bacterium]